MGYWKDKKSPAQAGDTGLALGGSRVEQREEGGDLEQVKMKDLSLYLHCPWPPPLPSYPPPPPLWAVMFKTEITVFVAWFLWWRRLAFGFREQEDSVSRNYPTPKSSRQIRKYHYRLELTWIRTTLIGLAICGTLPENKIASGSHQSKRCNYPRMSDNLSTVTLSVRACNACRCCNAGFHCWQHLGK